MNPETSIDNLSKFRMKVCNRLIENKFQEIYKEKRILRNKIPKSIFEKSKSVDRESKNMIIDNQTVLKIRRRSLECLLCGVETPKIKRLKNSAPNVFIQQKVRQKWLKLKKENAGRRSSLHMKLSFRKSITKI